MPFRTEEEGGQIKPANYKQEFTLAQVDELLKCEESPQHFLKNYGWIIHPTKGKVRFKLFDYQERMLDNYMKYNRCISMLPRQMGKTESGAGFLLWWAMFKEKQTILILSRQGEHAKEILARVKNLYLECPWFVKCGLVVDNVYELKFDNGSRIISQATTPNSGRGYSISLLMIDELAYIDCADELWVSLMPTVPPEGKIILTSTPNTDLDKFAHVWYSAADAPNSTEWSDDVNGRELPKKKKVKIKTKFENDVAEQRYIQDTRRIIKDKTESTDQVGYVRFFAHWTEHPERDETFKIQKLAEISQSEWEREYSCKFISQDPTLVDSMAMNKLGYYTQDPILVDKHGMQWFEDLEPNQAYAVAHDPGEGVDGDNSVIQVWAIPQLIQIAEWAANDYDQIDQTKLLIRVLKMIDKFQQNHPDHSGESMLYYTVECNGVGMGVINLLLAEEEHIDIPGMLIDSDGNKSRGVRTTAPTKRDYCLRLKTLLERFVFTPSSRLLLSELKTFIRRGKSFEAKNGCKDDRVMACVIMLHMLDEIIYHEDGLEEVLNLKSVASGEFYETEDDNDGSHMLPMF